MSICRTLQKFLIELKRKPGQSSVDRLLNSLLIVNPLPLKNIMEVDSLRKTVLVKQPITIAIAMVMHDFHPVLEHGLPPSLNLNHNAYSIFPRIHLRRESMAVAAHRNILPLPELSE